MFAVLKTGGKQYKVQAGDVLRVEKLAANAGDTVQFNEILMVGSTLGAPLVAGAGVQAEVIEQIKADKVITYVKRRRKHSSQRTRGHRQQLTLLRVTEVLESGADKSGVKEAIGFRTAGASFVAAPAADKKPAAKAKKPAKAKVEAADAAAPAKAAKKPAKAKKAAETSDEA
ncbi:50S ribosomal protein L21 [Paracoccus zhejiangensis]|uniref:Large ribosomal subunit protein bL21 n=1 Tax=Paracoccus zhejiangensis TaxID=1077935 RepID=A0A2H5EVD8_9RHOB|nr:50S ribosomal protein L21 [Paracoccus zhejiangensis]